MGGFKIVQPAGRKVLCGHSKRFGSGRRCGCSFDFACQGFAADVDAIPEFPELIALTGKDAGDISTAQLRKPEAFNAPVGAPANWG